MFLSGYLPVPGRSIKAGLSFLGIGVSPGTATWGSMVSDGYKSFLPIRCFLLRPASLLR
jgi:ABC-type dipeptide/oligopeptide/nickel transport system permease subunit